MAMIDGVRNDKISASTVKDIDLQKWFSRNRKVYIRRNKGYCLLSGPGFGFYRRSIFGFYVKLPTDWYFEWSNVECSDGGDASGWYPRPIYRRFKSIEEAQSYLDSDKVYQYESDVRKRVEN